MNIFDLKEIISVLVILIVCGSLVVFGQPSHDACGACVKFCCGSSSLSSMAKFRFSVVVNMYRVIKKKSSFQASDQIQEKSYKLYRIFLTL